MNLATEVASVTYQPERIQLDALTAAVTKAGYTATPRHAGVRRSRARTRQTAQTPVTASCRG